MIKQYLKLTALKAETPYVEMMQGDTGREMECTFSDFEIPVGAAACVYVNRPNSSFYTIPAEVNGQRVLFDATQAITTFGVVHCNLEITKDDKKIQSFPFYIRVVETEAGSPSTEEKGTTVAELDERVTELEEADFATEEWVEEQGYVNQEWVEDQHFWADGQLHTQRSTAGAKGWYIKAYDEGLLPISEMIELCNADGSTADINQFNLNDILSCKAGFSANYCWKIEDISEYDEGWYLIVSRTDNFSMLAQGAPFDPAAHLYPNPTGDGLACVWKPNDPMAGTVEFGYGAMSAGWDNKANELGSFAIGDDNEVDGRYAFATGQRNKVAYGSTALGHDNKVYGYDSLAAGSNNTVRNWRATAIGQTNSMNAVNGFASGHGNNATSAARDGISIRGTYATTQNSDTFIDVVGGGTDNEHRANASALTPAGNLRLKGDVFVNCQANSSGGTNLRTELEKKEEKGTYTLLDEMTVTADTQQDIWHYLSRPCRSVLVWLSFPRTYAENYRIFANEAYNQNGGQIGVTTGGTGVTNAKMKFDCTHGILEAEWAKQDGLGGYVAKTTYSGFENEPVITSAIESIIIKNMTSGIIRQGTKIKIYGY